MPIVTVHPNGEVIYLDPDETVLSGRYRAGYAYAIGCRRGGCAVCKVDCLSGRFNYDHLIADTVLTAEERSDGTCLTCRAVPKGDITIEMRDENLRLINPFLRQLNEKALLRAKSVLSGTESKE
jgi:CDP-4-dehydro-6-deoxyglucose reductase